MRRVVIVTLLCLAQGVSNAQAPTPAKGPLRVLQSNPRWFTDGSGRAICLAGSHVWQSLQDSGLLIRGATSNPPQVFDYDAYLAFLRRHNHNFFRLWRWEVTKWTDDYTDGKVKYCRPHPWMRTGPGTANDGAPKFDLTKFDPEYFDRLRSRLQKARDAGIYVSVMLFEGWALQFTDGWANHPFHAPNNVNGIEADLDGDGKGTEYTMINLDEPARRVLDLQEAYVRLVVDTVNEFDNVLYEICNESHEQSTEWQYHMIRFVKEYEARKTRQHPVGMTFQYKGGTNEVLFNSPADWISPNPGDARQSYRDEPCANCTTKVVVNDTDHLWGHTGGDNIWVWRSFTRGLNVLLMEEILPSPTWQDSARQAMGQVLRWSGRVNLADMRPDQALSTTGYCLASPGKEYLVFQSNKGEFNVNLTGARGLFQATWFNVNLDREIPARTVEGGASRTFTTPFPGPAVLHLKRTE